MNEAIFQQEIKESINWLWQEAFYHKLTDTTGTRFTAKKPFDCFFIESGIGYALELKQHKLNAPFPIKNVKSHQISGLLGWEMSGGKAFVLINWRLPDRSSNQTWAFEVDQWRQIIRDHPNWKSITLKELSRMGHEILRQKLTITGGLLEPQPESQTVWDLRPLLTYPQCGLLLS